ncbi:MAG: NAD(P)/FAD-dependent oxidoreductase [Clostridia bacterium]|nr:NAD(P)/FAD-dependent oxidoreductase [Clostridia bacterium]
MDVVVIGGGAAGMMAAITSAKESNHVILVEKTSSLGSKIKITGKGRCNLTFDGNSEDFKKNIVKNYKFMYSSFTRFSNVDVVQFFNDLGVKTKVERGGRVFPVSDDANEIVEALKKELVKNKVKVLYRTTVEDFILQDEKIIGVKLNNGETLNCDKCIITTGGKSYPSTGSTGDGYEYAKKLGHTIVDLKPGLVPLRSNDKICKELQGLSLRNVGLKLIDKENKIIYQDFGEMMFSHFGITGPMVLSASSKLNRVENVETDIANNKIMACIDLKPALDSDTLDKRVCRDFEKYANKEFKNSLDDLLPKKLIPVIMKLSKIEEDKKVNQINKEERKGLVHLLKELRVSISGFMPFDIAVITSGGIDVKDINPKTMESKKIKGVYFAGEILDVDAYTGGFNLQIAFSTAYAAGKDENIIEKKGEK